MERMFRSVDSVYATEKMDDMISNSSSISREYTGT